MVCGPEAAENSSFFKECGNPGLRRSPWRGVADRLRHSKKRHRDAAASDEGAGPRGRASTTDETAETGGRHAEGAGRKEIVPEPGSVSFRWYSIACRFRIGRRASAETARIRRARAPSRAAKPRQARGRAPHAMSPPRTETKSPGIVKLLPSIVAMVPAGPIPAA